MPKGYHRITEGELSRAICKNPECRQRFTPIQHRQRYCNPQCKNRHCNRITMARLEARIADRMVDAIKASLTHPPPPPSPPSPPSA